MPLEVAAVYRDQGARGIRNGKRPLTLAVENQINLAQALSSRRTSNISKSTENRPTT